MNSTGLRSEPAIAAIAFMRDPDDEDERAAKVIRGDQRLDIS